MIAILPILGGVAAWFALSVIVDGRNARRENVPAISFIEMAVVLAAALLGTLLAPPAERLGVGVALAGLGVAAYGDLRHGYLWEEISVPTLFAVLAAAALGGLAESAIAGSAVLGGTAVVVYFGGQLTKRDTGFGDIIPTAIVGTALGPVAGLGAFAVACTIFAVVALALGKRFGVALPFGPAIAGSLLVGAAGSLLLPGWR